MASVAEQVDILLAGLRYPSTDEPLAQGEVFTYLDGTSTLSALWTDRDKSANASNPITLDNAGKAEVYGDNIYKFEIYEPRQPDGTIGASVNTITGIDLFASTSQDNQWSVRGNDVIAYVSATSFTVIGDVTSNYEAGRRIRAEGSATGTIYGTISSSSYVGGTNKTTVNVDWDSGSLNDETLEMALSLLTVTEPSIPRQQTKTVTSVTTLDYTDYGKTVLVDYSSGSYDITLPAHSDGWWVKFICIDAANSGNIDDSGGSAQLSLNAVGDVIFIVSDGSSWRTDFLPTIPTGGGSNGEILETDGSAFSFVEPDNRYAPATHATTHKDGNSDELDAAELAGALGTNGQVLTTDGAAVSWSTFTVSQGDLVTSQGSVSTTSGAGVHLTLPGGEYGFYPQLNGDINGASLSQDNNFGSYTTSIFLVATSGTVYARQRYITASGEVYWIFIAKAKSDGHILGIYQAPDHPCFGNGGDPDLVSHPFNRFRDSNDNLIDFDVLVINPNFETIKDIHSRTPKSKDLMETLFAEYDIDEFIEPLWPDKYITVDVVNNDFPFAAKTDKATVVKQKIKKPDTIKTAGLKKKITKLETK